MRQKNVDLSKKWTHMQIIALINAYKEETCLYAVSTQYHRNKRVRNDALRRVGNAVRILRPNASDQDCSLKFHMLRTQYNIKNSQVKSSMKSGTENVYKPNLWYYHLLGFLDPYFSPRRRKNSRNTEDFETVVCEDFTDDSKSNIFVTEKVEYEDDINASLPDQSPSPSLSPLRPISPSLTIVRPPPSPSSTIVRPPPSPSPVFVRPPSSPSPTIVRLPTSPSPTIVRPSLSPSSELSSSSGVSSGPLKRKAPGDHADAIATLVDYIRQPIVGSDASKRTSFIAPMSSPAEDIINGFLKFLGSIIRTIENEEVKFDLMSNLIQTAFNTRKQDMDRTHKS